MKLIESSPHLLDEEMTILNSDSFFNRISKDKDNFTQEEIVAEIEDGKSMGAERFLIQDDGEYVGVLEYLMKNPNDGYTWLGLLQIRKDAQSSGYGRKVLELFYDIMQQREVGRFRLGVIAENEPGHRFWKRQGLLPIKSVVNQDNKTIIVYEKELS
ncbi:GNAT family N-acetyltransferase [Paenibacillus dendrobii]|nr:GNAT family N-acetyltransferase [Paenibacillus dendrobii]